MRGATTKKSARLCACEAASHEGVAGPQSEQSKAELSPETTTVEPHRSKQALNKPLVDERPHQISPHAAVSVQFRGGRLRGPLKRGHLSIRQRVSECDIRRHVFHAESLQSDFPEGRRQDRHRKYSGTDVVDIARQREFRGAATSAWRIAGLQNQNR